MAIQRGAPCALPEAALGNLPILRDGLTLPSHGALPAGPDALVFAEFSRFLPGTIVVSMAGDGHGRRRPEAGGRTCTLHPSAESLRSAMFGDSVVVRPRKIVG